MFLGRTEGTHLNLHKCYGWVLSYPWGHWSHLTPVSSIKSHHLTSPLYILYKQQKATIYWGGSDFLMCSCSLWDPGRSHLPASNLALLKAILQGHAPSKSFKTILSDPPQQETALLAGPKNLNEILKLPVYRDFWTSTQNCPLSCLENPFLPLPLHSLTP